MQRAVIAFWPTAAGTCFMPNGHARGKACLMAAYGRKK